MTGLAASRVTHLTTYIGTVAFGSSSPPGAKRERLCGNRHGLSTTLVDRQSSFVDSMSKVEKRYHQSNFAQAGQIRGPLQRGGV